MGTVAIGRRLQDLETSTDRVLELARQALAAVDEGRVRMWERLGLTMQQIRFMYLLLRHGAAPRVTELAEEMHVHPATITGLTDRLVAMGLVVRHIDADDRRVKHIELTPHGRIVLTADPSTISTVRDALGHLDREEAASLTHALEEVDRSLIRGS